MRIPETGDIQGMEANKHSRNWKWGDKPCKGVPSLHGCPIHLIPRFLLLLSYQPLGILDAREPCRRRWRARHNSLPAFLLILDHVSSHIFNPQERIREVLPRSLINCHRTKAAGLHSAPISGYRPGRGGSVRVRDNFLNECNHPLTGLEEMGGYAEALLACAGPLHAHLHVVSHEFTHATLLVLLPSPPVRESNRLVRMCGPDWSLF
jgi:hypothetical protein